MSFNRNGAEVVIKEYMIVELVISENCIQPDICTGNMANIEMMNLSFVFLILHIIPQRYAVKINPVKNPPVIPVITDKPPLNPEKTGMPKAPRSMYMATAATPLFFPRINPVKATANVCKVRGTPDGRGIHICEHTAIIAVHRAVYVNDNVFFICFAFLCF